MTTLRRRVLRPPPLVAEEGPRQEKLAARRAQLVREQAHLARWMSRLSNRQAAPDVQQHAAAESPVKTRKRQETPGSAVKTWLPRSSLGASPQHLVSAQLFSAWRPGALAFPAF